MNKDILEYLSKHAPVFFNDSILGTPTPYDGCKGEWTHPTPVPCTAAPDRDDTRPARLAWLSATYRGRSFRFRAEWGFGWASRRISGSNRKWSAGRYAAAVEACRRFEKANGMPSL